MAQPVSYFCGFQRYLSQSLGEHSCRPYLFVVVQLLSHVRLLRLHGLQHTRLPCPSLSPGVCLNSHPLNQWCYLTISSSAACFSFCLSQPQSLFNRVGSLHQVTKVLEPQYFYLCEFIRWILTKNLLSQRYVHLGC